MKLFLRIAVVVFALFLVSSLGIIRSQAQNTLGGEYFPEYGQVVRGEFLEKYYSVDNPRELFGLPISRHFISPLNGRLVQYFEKVRFEAGVNSSVQISDLGKMVFANAHISPEPGNSADCQDFPQTGFQVCRAFLEFFNANGGVSQFGYPISNLGRRPDGQLVQYFEKALLELHPNLPVGKHIVVAELGRIAFYQIGEDPNMLAAEDDGWEIDNIVSLKVHAYPRNAVLPRSGAQTIYVIVQDQRLLPVYGVTVELKYTLPSGEHQLIKIPGTTGKNGVIQYTFAYSTKSLGIATVEVLVWLGDKVTGQTFTSFRIWW